MQRVTTRLIELGILTPEQGIQTIKTGLYPETAELLSKQEAYIEERQKGYYTPLVGGQPVMPEEEEDENGMPENTNQPESEQPTVQNVVDDENIEPRSGPVTVGRPRKKVKQERGRPSGSDKRDNLRLSTKAVQEVVYEIEDLLKFAQKEMRSSYKIKRLSKEKKELLDELCKTVVISTPQIEWEKQVTSCIKDFSGIGSLVPMLGVLEASQEHELEVYPAALVHHAQEKDSQTKKKSVKKE